ncbi:putative transcription regulator A20-like family [Helianthus annuus]|uniref:Transcription regulator A20-like family n=1 Tax=Helianthus annuus TaxID=4232 RepID=A0A9K3HQP6_HELAN|nr:zinc finger A20 and AN1 domain-containing stress-associated protein 8 [Helianthus annuus]XP_021993928.1 zinc finger A20 and AN1 domain-containing stress-associated protein 8 [Helianthus annuus]XP_035836173.1 zinc finger A20 and AN1 domain-containing stress-associated protein 8 [Helianthus annuus]KAF5782636.1 putative transcription regulator A20-like family [Helianthus annuus]KAF5782639.1 putative transcription regulator A20-like family [Helianthus annuus]KAJ0502108.1 putative transcription 
MEKNDTGCQATLEAPILCVNNCGFFGTPATMNMCSKCHKDMILKQEEAKLAASSIESIVNGQNINKTTVLPNSAGSEVALSTQPSSAPQVQAESSEKPKEVQGQGQGPSRCTTCRKRVGLTGFSCRCGHVFCSVHRYSDKHDCQFDYRATAKDAIAKANPVVKAEKLDKI